MKLTELANGEEFLKILEDLAEIDGTYDMDPKTKAFVKMGQKITASLSIGSGVEWPDDEQFNKAAKLGQQLSSIGSSFGAKNAGEALKADGVTHDEAKEIIGKVKDAKIDIAKTVKDPDHSGEDKLAKAIADA